MKIKMLATKRGTLNNGKGNISMDYLEGGVYDAPLEDAEWWIANGWAVAIPLETPEQTQTIETQDVAYQTKVVKTKRKK